MKLKNLYLKGTLENNYLSKEVRKHYQKERQKMFSASEKRINKGILKKNFDLPINSN